VVFLVFSLIAKNSAQGLSKGTVVGSGSFVVTSAGITIHTVPAGRRQKIRFQYVIRIMTTAHRIRFRVGDGILIDEKGTGIVAPPAISTDLGLFTLNAGQTVGVASGNVATEGATCLAAVSVIEDTPV